MLKHDRCLLANIHSIIASESCCHAASYLYDVPRKHNVGLPPLILVQYVGPASQLIAGLMPVNRLQCWPNITSTSAQRNMLLGATNAATPRR